MMAACVITVSTRWLYGTTTELFACGSITPVVGERQVTICPLSLRSQPRGFLKPYIALFFEEAEAVTCPSYPIRLFMIVVYFQSSRNLTNRADHQKNEANVAYAMNGAADT